MYGKLPPIKIKIKIWNVKHFTGWFMQNVQKKKILEWDCALVNAPDLNKNNLKG